MHEGNDQSNHQNSNTPKLFFFSISGSACKGFSFMVCLVQKRSCEEKVGKREFEMREKDEKQSRFDELFGIKEK